MDNVRFDLGKTNFRYRKAIEKLGATLLFDNQEVNVVYELKKNVFLLIKNQNQ